MSAGIAGSRNRVYHHVPVLTEQAHRDAARSFAHDGRTQSGQTDGARRGDHHGGEPVHVAEAGRHQVGQLQQGLIESLAHGLGGKVATASR